MVDELLQQIAGLIAAALQAARSEGRRDGLVEASKLCDHLAEMGTWEHTLGAAECANRIREKLVDGNQPR